MRVLLKPTKEWYRYRVKINLLSCNIAKAKDRTRNTLLMGSNLNFRSSQTSTLTMFPVSPTKFEFSLITSFQHFFGRLLPLLYCTRLTVLHLLTSVFIFLFLTWPNYLNLVSFILCSMGTTPTLTLITSFLILSDLVWYTTIELFPSLLPLCVNTHTRTYSGDINT